MTAHAEVLDSAYVRDRAFMVERHLKGRGISDPLLIAAMGTVPRETFVAEHLQEFAYEDSALPIEAGQTISQPSRACSSLPRSSPAILYSKSAPAPATPRR